MARVFRTKIADGLILIKQEEDHFNTNYHIIDQTNTY